MNPRLLYFVGAALFVIATGLNLYNEGVNLKTGVGVVLAGSLVMLALRTRPAGG